MKLEQLMKIATDLEELTESSGADSEGSHSLADSKLITALEILSKGTSHDVKSAVELIIKNYRAIEKLYA